MKNGIIIKRNTIFTFELAAMNQRKDEAVATTFCCCFKKSNEEDRLGLCFLKYITKERRISKREEDLESCFNENQGQESLFTFENQTIECKEDVFCGITERNTN